MPQVQPVASQVSVRADIQRASARTGVDFDYLLGQAGLESSLDPNAKASTSSARGLYQFINSTWLNTLEKHGGKHGLDWAAAQIEHTRGGPVVRDPAMRQQIMALRYDPQVASLMAGEFANDNRQTLQAALGRAPNGTDLYLAHFLGPAGATSFLQNAASNPGASAASLFPNAAATNRGIFYDGNGAARSLGQVYGLLETKMARAIERHGGEADPASGFAADSPDAYAEFAIAAMDGTTMPTGIPSYMEPPTRMAPTQIASAAPVSAGPRPSMADTLRSSFGLDNGGNDAAMANVRKAYGALKAFNL